jgi:chorismate mutase
MRAELVHRIEELSREIRNYPTPIARCDEQLGGLIEERARLLQQMKEFQEETDGGVNAA